MRIEDMITEDKSTSRYLNTSTTHLLPTTFIENDQGQMRI